MKRQLPISIFFPAYNEEDNIAATVRHTERVIQEITDTYEIIIVDDGSSDKTPQIADRIAKENSRVKVVHHDPNRGYGAALWSGIQAAKYDWVFFTDADLQFRLEEIQKLVDFIPEYPVILGYRAPRRDPFMRLVNAKGWNILNRILFGLKVRDIDCAFKLFNRKLVASLPLKTRGAMMSAEMLIRLQRKGVKFKEVPVTHLPRVMGSPTGAKPAVIIRAFRELFRLYKGELGQVQAVTYAQIGKFAAVGLLNTAVDLIAYYGLTRFTVLFATQVVSAKVISFFLGTICSFTLNRRFTFSLTSRITAPEVIRFYTVTGIGLIINAATLYIFHQVFGVHDLIAVAIATVLTFVWGFVLSKVWVFGKMQPKGEPAEKIAY
jgi:glycosyltransferase involved in cell wall biosynthesis